MTTRMYEDSLFLYIYLTTLLCSLLIIEMKSNINDILQILRAVRLQELTHYCLTRIEEMHTTAQQLYSGSYRLCINNILRFTLFW